MLAAAAAAALLPAGRLDMGVVLRLRCAFPLEPFLPVPFWPGAGGIARVVTARTGDGRLYHGALYLGGILRHHQGTIRQSGR